MNESIETVNIASSIPSSASITLNYKTAELPFLSMLFPNLTTLKAIKCSIQSIKREVFKGLNELDFLSLAYNHIEIIPEDVFCDLVYLETLDISGNLVKVLSHKLFEANPNLIGVIACKTLITELPKNIFVNNLQLKHVDFCDGSLKTIEVDFTKFSNMLYVNLYNNPCFNATFIKPDRRNTVNRELKHQKTLQEVGKSTC